MTAMNISTASSPDQLILLADRANEAHRQAGAAVVSALVHALEAGKALAEAQALVRYGGWEDWLDSNFKGSPRSARRWMRLYRERDRLPGGDPLRTGASDLTPSAALGLLAREAEGGREALSAEEQAELDRHGSTIQRGIEAGAASWRALAARAAHCPDGAERLKRVVASIRRGPPLPVQREDLAAALATWSLEDLRARLLTANAGQPRLCGRILLAIESRGLHRPEFRTLDAWREEHGWAGEPFDTGLAWARDHPDVPAELPISEADCCLRACLLLEMAGQDLEEARGARPSPADRRAFNDSMDACVLVGAATGRPWQECLRHMAMALCEQQGRAPAA